MLLSLRDGEDVIIVGRVDLPVVAKRHQFLLEVRIVQLLLDHVPNVTLVDELVRLGNLLHHLKNQTLAVPCACTVKTGVSCRVVTATSSEALRASDSSGTLSLLSHQSTV